MNKKYIKYILISIVLFAAGIIIGSKCKEDSLAQELCKYAEYDFCKVSSYQINIRKGK